MVFDWFALWAEWKRPEAVQMDLFTEASSHGVHEEPGGRTLDVDIVGQPIPVDKEMWLAALTKTKYTAKDDDVQGLQCFHLVIPHLYSARYI